MFLMLYLFSHIFHSLLYQEIELLSRFEHENIVQYYGTEMVISSCHIFSLSYMFNLIFYCYLPLLKIFVVLSSYVQFDIFFLLTIFEFVLKFAITD